MKFGIDLCRCYLPMPCSFLGICRKCGSKLRDLPPRHDWCPIRKLHS